jgi:hypothetical protein
MMRRVRVAVLCALAALASSAFASAASTPTPDPGAVTAIRRYIDALSKPDAPTAFALLTAAQQRYFGNARNFGSNFATTQYRVVSYAIERATQREPTLVEADVDQVVSYLDVSTGQTARARIAEPYFALFDGKTWGVKELVQPWKSYAPKATGRADGLVVIVDRIEFFDRRVKVDCTLQNLGTMPIQVLPLLKSTLSIAPGATYAALDTPDYPLNDKEFFEGVRIYPGHETVGYVNFPVPSHADVDSTAVLTIAPAIADGATAPAAASVGPMTLPKL